MLEAVNLECARGDRTLFSGLSFQLTHGQLLHVVGANGSGKTTLLRTLCGLTRPASGLVRWSQQNIADLGDNYHRDIAYVGHRDGVHAELTASENLALGTCLVSEANRRAIAAALERLTLGAYAHFPAKILSQGQKRRLALARLLIGKKSLWILDEPLTALDTASTRLMMTLIEEQLAGGGIVALSSHQELTLSTPTLKQIDLDCLQQSFPVAEEVSTAPTTSAQRS